MINKLIKIIVTKYISCKAQPVSYKREVKKERNLVELYIKKYTEIT